jgi:hypothetical protein
MTPTPTTTMLLLLLPRPCPRDVGISMKEEHRGVCQRMLRFGMDVWPRYVVQAGFSYDWFFAMWMMLFHCPEHIHIQIQGMLYLLFLEGQSMLMNMPSNTFWIGFPK